MVLTSLSGKASILTVMVFNSFVSFYKKQDRFFVEGPRSISASYLMLCTVERFEGPTCTKVVMFSFVPQRLLHLQQLDAFCWKIPQRVITKGAKFR